MKVHEKIRFLRTLKGWSQEEIAHNLDMSISGYGSIERGETDIPLSRLEQLAKIFKIDLIDLLNINEKQVLNISAYCNKDSNISNISIHSELELKNKFELEKAKLIIEQQKKEIEYLKEIIALKTKN